jgi:hypothetical protein
MDQLILKSFAKEMEKISDLIFGKGGKVVAGGLFAGVDDPEESKARSEEIRSLLQQHGSIKSTKSAYENAHPGEFITSAFKMEDAPKSGFIKKLIKGKKYIESEQKSYGERSASPRVFIRTGPAGGYHQSAFYKEVERGYNDNELSQSHIPKEQRVIYI